MSVHIRQVGDFTQALGERLGVGPSVVVSMTQAALKGSETDIKGGMRGDFVELDQTANALPLPTIRIDGPYGAPAEDVFNAEVAVLIGAGIGEQIPSFIDVAPQSHSKASHLLRLSSSTYGIDKRDKALALFAVLNFSGFAEMHRPLAGSRACFKRLRPRKLIVRNTLQYHSLS